MRARAGELLLLVQRDSTHATDRRWPRRPLLFRVEDGRLSPGPAVRAATGDRVRLLIDVTPDGAVAFSAGTGGRFTRVSGRPGPVLRRRAWR
jgi:hypothetical protein